MSDQARREVARRLFATEFDDITSEFAESDDQMAPKYALLPTGVRANRVFIVGVATTIRDVGSDGENYQIRVADPTGTVDIYAGEYEPECVEKVRDLETPAFLAVVGKPRLMDDAGGPFIRPESIQVVDPETRADWLVETAQQTVDRVEAFDPDTDPDAERASEVYGEAVAQYRTAAKEALEAIADPADRDAGETDSDAEADAESVSA